MCGFSLASAFAPRRPVTGVRHRPISALASMLRIAATVSQISHEMSGNLKNRRTDKESMTPSSFHQCTLRDALLNISLSNSRQEIISLSRRKFTKQLGSHVNQHTLQI